MLQATLDCVLSIITAIRLLFAVAYVHIAGLIFRNSPYVQHKLFKTEALKVVVIADSTGSSSAAAVRAGLERLATDKDSKLHKLVDLTVLLTGPHQEQAEKHALAGNRRVVSLSSTTAILAAGSSSPVLKTNHSEIVSDPASGQPRWMHGNSEEADKTNRWATTDMANWQRAVWFASLINKAAATVAFVFKFLVCGLPCAIVSSLVSCSSCGCKSTSNSIAGVTAFFNRLRTAQTLSISSVNHATTGCCNPLAWLSLRFYMCRVFGVSPDFFNHVAVPVYASSVLSGKDVATVPASLAPLLDANVTVSSADPHKRHLFSARIQHDVSPAVFFEGGKDHGCEQQEQQEQQHDDNHSNCFAKYRVFHDVVVEFVDPVSNPKKRIVRFWKKDGTEVEEHFDAVVFATANDTAHKLIQSRAFNTAAGGGGTSSSSSASLGPLATLTSELLGNLQINHCEPALLLSRLHFWNLRRLSLLECALQGRHGLHFANSWVLPATQESSLDAAILSGLRAAARIAALHVDKSFRNQHPLLGCAASEDEAIKYALSTNLVDAPLAVRGFAEFVN